MAEAAQGIPSATVADKGAELKGITASCFTGIGTMLYENSFILMYLAAMGVKEDKIIAYLAFPSIAKMLILIPSAHYSKRLGLIKGGFLGHMVCLLGMGCLLFAPFLAPYHKEWMLIAPGVIIEGIGWSIYVTSWFPLTTALVPEDRRASFFSKLRVSYQIVSIAFMFIAIAVLDRKIFPDMRVFQVFLGIGIVVKGIGAIIYLALPDRTPSGESAPKTGMFKSVLNAIGAPGFMPFCAYVFLLSVATGSCTSLFRLMAKVALGFSKDEVLLMGNLGTMGALLGLILGGAMTTRFGTKLTFLVCHFSFGVILIGFLMRVFIPVHPLLLVCMLSLLFGMIWAASGIAVVTEMLNLLPTKNKPMATALNQVLLNLGVALAGIFSSQAIGMGILTDGWKFFGGTMNQYDTLLLIYGAMIMMLSVTLGLVPSVVKKIQWYVD